MRATLLLISAAIGVGLCQKDPNFADGRTAIVQMFEWKWKDIADECDNFLGPNGFGGVQTSPPNENVVWRLNVTDVDRPWWEIYQPVSYLLNTRHGTEAEFTDMVKRCNNAGVRIYPDVVVNHMAVISTIGTAGSTCSPKVKDYPAVPFTEDDFHPSCDINWNDGNSLRNCELSGMPDLNQTHPEVRQKIVDFFNHLISIGVAGFRMDAAKHMWPSDLKAIYESTSDLNTDFFPAGSRAFFYQEVPDVGPAGAVSKNEYTDFGRVCEFAFGTDLGPCFHGQCPFDWFNTFGFDYDQWGIIDGEHTVVFVANHDTERDYQQWLSYKDDKLYRGAVAFMLAHNYTGIPRIMSGFNFTNRDAGPPENSDESIISPLYAETGCSNGWTCEHRWTSSVGMVGFRNAVIGTTLDKYYSNDKSIAFSRGDKGLFAVTIQEDITSVETNIADGTYCDVVTGNLSNGACTGRTVTVSGGIATLNLSPSDAEIAMAVHVGSKLS